MAKVSYGMHQIILSKNVGNFMHTFLSYAYNGRPSKHIFFFMGGVQTS